MITKIVVPDKTSMLRALDLLQEYNKSVINNLDKKFPQGDWRIIDSFTARRCINIHRMFYTLRSLLIPSFDDCSVNTLLRSLADHITSLLLIYSGLTKDEILLRHLLCIADGINERKKLVNLHRGDNNIDVLNMEYDLTECKKCIRQCPLYFKHKNRIEYLIKKRIWKYKSLTYNENYNWSKLYRDVLEIKKIIWIIYRSMFTGFRAAFLATKAMFQSRQLSVSLGI